jgi:predicted transcriptional regulator
VVKAKKKCDGGGREYLFNLFKKAGIEKKQEKNCK